MKPSLPGFAVVTATLDPDRAAECLGSWIGHGTRRWELIVVQDQMGVVPAFAQGIAQALRAGAEIIACLHDDLLIEEDGWDVMVATGFKARPAMGLCGFGGGTGLGHQDIYRKAYSPYDLAREGFVSNMRDAEAHGRRVRALMQVACLDGFSQIGRREFWTGGHRLAPVLSGLARMDSLLADKADNLLQQMADWGITHHAYDSALGAWAKRLGWEVWMLPVACHHFGGRTAVGDARYAEWAETIVPGGDRTFWELAHREVYDRFRDVLPIRI